MKDCMLIEEGRIARMITAREDKDIRGRSLIRETRTTMSRGRLIVQEVAWCRLLELELEVRRIEIQSIRSSRERDMSDSLT